MNSKQPISGVLPSNTMFIGQTCQGCLLPYNRSSKTLPKMFKKKVLGKYIILYFSYEFFSEQKY